MASAVPALQREELANVFADPAAFRRWYDVAVVRVYGYLYGRCAGDMDLAEELTQQTFLQAVRHWQSYDGRADVVTWLCSIARNKLTDHYRDLDRQHRRQLRLMVREIEMTDIAMDRAVVDREVVLEALRGLPPLQRAALILRYVDGLSVREVAAALDRSEDATNPCCVAPKTGSARCTRRRPMSDERLGRDLRAVDAPATPRPEFVEDLFAQLEDELGKATSTRSRGPARRRRPQTNGPLLFAAALLVGGAVVGSALVAAGARTPTAPTPASVLAVASPPSPTTTAAADVASTPRPQPSYLAFGPDTPGLSALQGAGLVVYERRELSKLTRLRALPPDEPSREFAPDVPGTQTGAAWAPDGRQLVFAAADIEKPAAWRIWTTDPDGTSPS